MSEVPHISDNLTQLGSKVDWQSDPNTFPLEGFPSPQGFKGIVRFTCPEFTSLCPKTGQPDFATIIIDYCPKTHMIESKSLKLFLTSFRNHGGFHEECTQLIADKIWRAVWPTWLRVAGIFSPRGGIPIDVFVQKGETPYEFDIPELEVRAYRAR